MHRLKLGIFLAPLALLLVAQVAVADVGGKMDAANAATQNGLADLVIRHHAWVEQLKAIAVTLCLAVIGTIIITYLVKAVLDLRVSIEVETAGLDLAEHGEEGYHTAGQL